MIKHRWVVNSWEAVQVQTILNHLDIEYDIRSLIGGSYFIKAIANDTEDVTLALLNINGEIH